MRKIIILLSLLLLIAVIVPAQEQSEICDPPDVPFSTITEALTVRSSVNEEDYLIFVGLPLNYATSELSYPVLYLLDPQMTFGTVTELTRTASWNNELPESIVVSIGYLGLRCLTTSQHGRATNEVLGLRVRDFLSTGQADFLQFIQEDLIPLIDTSYRTKPEDRALVGFAQSATFVLYALHNATDTFGRYLAASPSSYCASCEIETVPEHPVRLFLSAGEYDDTRRFVEERFSELEAANYPWLDVSMNIFEDTSLLMSVPIAMSRGLKFVYCGTLVGQCQIVSVSASQ